MAKVTAPYVPAYKDMWAGTVRERYGINVKRTISVILCAMVCSWVAGCGRVESERPESAVQKVYPEEITLMHVDADKEGFQDFIRETEEKLQIRIHVLQSPQNADNRQAQISTILSSGDQSVDILTINDEMMSEFKHLGYLEPLDTSVMSKETLACYPADYMEQIAVMDGKVYSVPFLMDVMMFWVNEDFIEKAGLTEVADLADFETLVETYYGEGLYGYGSAWEESYVYNEMIQFVNLFGGDYQDWDDENTRKAVVFLHDMLQNGCVPKEQLLDQYEQMEQKFLSGQYGSIFMYAGAIETFLRAGIYGEDGIHVVKLPGFAKKVTNVATWQYVLNKASDRKEAAKKFLAYAASREGCVAYCSAVNCLPARLDVLMEEELDIPDIDIIRDYVSEVQLKPRTFTRDSMEGIRRTGKAFQKYVSDEITLDEFCANMQEIVDDAHP